MVIFVCLLYILGMKNRALHMLAKYSATELYFPHFSCFLLRQILTQKAGLELNLSYTGPEIVVFLLEPPKCLGL